MVGIFQGDLGEGEPDDDGEVSDEAEEVEVEGIEQAVGAAGGTPEPEPPVVE